MKILATQSALLNLDALNHESLLLFAKQSDFGMNTSKKTLNESVYGLCWPAGGQEQVLRNVKKGNRGNHIWQRELYATNASK
jgi:hypothetical protein